MTTYGETVLPLLESAIMKAYPNNTTIEGVSSTYYLNFVDVGIGVTAFKVMFLDGNMFVYQIADTEQAATPQDDCNTILEALQKEYPNG